jgi:hypothetical protein
VPYAARQPLPPTTTSYFSSVSLRWLFIAVLAGLPVISLAGCGNNGRAPVHGRVALDGQPLAGAGITFRPEGGGRESTAVTNDDGQYVLKYIRDEFGGTLGKNSVRITKQRSRDPSSEIVPDKYNRKTTLEREVKPGDNEIDFLDLTSK